MIICNLQKLLKRRYWSRYKLRQKTKISYPTLQALFHGRSKGYSAAVLNKLCYALKCQPGDLLKWKPDRFARSKSKGK
jgi:putative transcriptional regulator